MSLGQVSHPARLGAAMGAVGLKLAGVSPNEGPPSHSVAEVRAAGLDPEAFPLLSELLVARQFPPSFPRDP
eukprot:1194215-Prorocentrum_minimum.AAC.5